MAIEQYMRRYDWTQKCQNGKKPLYLEVTKDRYSLPLAVADTMAELARRRGVDVGNISKGVKTAERGGSSKYIRVWVDQEELA